MNDWDHYGESEFMRVPHNIIRTRNRLPVAKFDPNMRVHGEESSDSGAAAEPMVDLTDEEDDIAQVVVNMDAGVVLAAKEAKEAQLEYLREFNRTWSGNYDGKK